MNSNHQSTFSIVARDSKTGNIVVAGGSHWFAYATLVPFIEAGVGAIATQAETNVSYGPNGLKLLKQGKDPLAVVDQLTSNDEGRDYRQLLVIDNTGKTAAYTGRKCVKYAYHYTEDNFAVAGNMLATDKILETVISTFKNLQELPFALRIIKALQAGQNAGGDLRGKRSAGLLMSKGSNTGEFWKDRIYDLRVDDNSNSFEELERLYSTAEAYRYMNEGDNEYYENQNRDLALANYKKAFELQPENLEVKFWYAKLLHDMAELTESSKLLNEIFQEEPKWQEYWNRVMNYTLTSSL